MTHQMQPSIIDTLGGFREGHLAILLYPEFTALDVFGPYHMFINLMGEKTHLVARTKDPVIADSGVRVLPDLTFEECPQDLLVICVPGGTAGTLRAMQDEDLLDFLRSRGKSAQWVASVCTGSLILAAAGLLNGYKATSHWVARDLLSEFGAEPINQRVVVDRNRITGAGVTAGLDCGLEIVARLRGDMYAEGVQLLSEYDPQPTFNAGTPEKSSPEIVGLMRGMFDDFVVQVKQVATDQQAKA
ncbi:MAG: DJ-1/PfpI family protein [Phototrophicaceae bacterium]